MTSTPKKQTLMAFVNSLFEKFRPSAILYPFNSIKLSSIPNKRTLGFVFLLSYLPIALLSVIEAKKFLPDNKVGLLFSSFSLLYSQFSAILRELKVLLSLYSG